MRVTIFIVLVLIEASCNPNKAQNEEHFKLIIPDTTKELGKNLNLWRVKANKTFELPLIHDGVDSFELRIWEGTKFQNPNKVRILNYADSSWKLTLAYLYSGLIEDSSQHEVINKLFLENRRASQTLSAIIYLLRDMQIERIPTQEELPSFEDTTTEGFYYTIELATNKYYKLLRYHNPDSFSRDLNNKNIASLIKYFHENQ
jgi:hypothetical protein